MDKAFNPNGHNIILGSTVSATQASQFQLDDVSKRNQTCVLANSGRQVREIDYSWLPLCAETYQISANIEDYIFSAVPIISCQIPNRNLQAFDFSEVSAWDVNQGRPVYRTFIGKPTYTNHKNNTIPHLAKGVHFDATLDYVPRYGLYKINVLLGFDKKKDTGLCEAIVANKGVTGYSMGAMVETFLDSVTGKFIGLNDADYKKGKGMIDRQSQRLRYLSCAGVTFFETSCLGDFGRGDPGEPPADFTATSDVIWG